MASPWPPEPFRFPTSSLCWNICRESSLFFPFAFTRSFHAPKLTQSPAPPPLFPSPRHCRLLKLSVGGEVSLASIVLFPRHVRCSPELLSDPGQPVAGPSRAPPSSWSAAEPSSSTNPLQHRSFFTNNLVRFVSAW
jgi:hypothetical protein